MRRLPPKRRKKKLKHGLKRRNPQYEQRQKIRTKSSGFTSNKISYNDNDDDSIDLLKEMDMDMGMEFKSRKKGKKKKKKRKLKRKRRKSKTLNARIKKVRKVEDVENEEKSPSTVDSDNEEGEENENNQSQQLRREDLTIDGFNEEEAENEEETISIAGSLSDFEDDFELNPELDHCCPICEFDEKQFIMPEQMVTIRKLINKGKKSGNLKKAIKEVVDYYDEFLKDELDEVWDEKTVKNHFLNHIGGDNEYHCKKNLHLLSLLQRNIIKHDLIRIRNDGPVDSDGKATKQKHTSIQHAKLLITLIEKNINLRLKVNNTFDKQNEVDRRRKRMY